MANFELLSLSDAGKWREYLKMLPNNQQDIYFTPEYYRLYDEIGDGKAQCFVFQQGNVLALYPFLINSVNQCGFDLDKEYFDIQGAYGYNGVLSSSYDPDFVDAFYKTFGDWCNKNNVIAEFTRFHPLLSNVRFSKNHLLTSFDRIIVKLTLDNYSSIENIREISYCKQARKDYRQALKKGLYYSIANDEAEYALFYELYYDTMEHIGADRYYFFNQTFFRHVFQCLKDKHFLILIFNAEHILVGGFIIFLFGHFSSNFLSAGSISHRKMNINDLMQDIAIKIALEKGCSTLLFGGGNSPSIDDPLLKFKSKFSTETDNFYIGKKTHNPIVYDEVIRQWQFRYPEKLEKFKHHLLKYRC
jgi:lipid II:glycine glycyltransferase (peptidoglycan interpeptide bridge formation enzyme)